MLPRSNPSRFAVLVVCVVAAALTGGMATSPASAVTTAPVITQVGPAGGGGGFYGVYDQSFPRVEFTGAASTSASDYAVTVSGSHGLVETLAAYAETWISSDTFAASLNLAKLTDGQSYTIQVVEYPGTANAVMSAPHSWTLHYVQHPTRLSWVQPNTLVTPNVICAGAPATMIQVGSWGSTGQVVEHVWLSPSSSDPEALFAGDPSGSTKYVVGRPDQAINPKTWTVPTSAAGRWVWIMVHGSGAPANYLDYLFTWHVARAVKCVFPVWGKVSGVPRAGRSVTIGTPKTPANSKVTYHWKIGGKYITWTRPTYRFTSAQVGQTVVAQVDVYEPGNLHYRKFYTLSRVAR